MSLLSLPDRLQLIAKAKQLTNSSPSLELRILQGVRLATIVMSALSSIIYLVVSVLEVLGIEHRTMSNIALGVVAVTVVWVGVLSAVFLVRLNRWLASQDRRANAAIMKMRDKNRFMFALLVSIGLFLIAQLITTATTDPWSYYGSFAPFLRSFPSPSSSPDSLQAMALPLERPSSPSTSACACFSRTMRGPSTAFTATSSPFGAKTYQTLFPPIKKQILSAQNPR